jgi:hypothetical protein
MRERQVNYQRFPEIIKSIYAAARELEAMFPGRHFTPDGHMVGSIGEALGGYFYGINLYKASSTTHDGECQGREVQIKATQRDRIALSSCPEHLLVLSLSEDGGFKEEYNGPGELVWRLVSHKPIPKNGQYQIQLSTVRKLMSKVDQQLRIPRTHATPSAG